MTISYSCAHRKCQVQRRDLTTIRDNHQDDCNKVSVRYVLKPQSASKTDCISIKIKKCCFTQL